MNEHRIAAWHTKLDRGHPDYWKAQAGNAGIVYYGKCFTCGWRGKRRNDWLLAMDDARVHQTTVEVANLVGDMDDGSGDIGVIVRQWLDDDRNTGVRKTFAEKVNTIVEVVRQARADHQAELAADDGV
jgi:hypothetical protein